MGQKQSRPGATPEADDSEDVTIEDTSPIDGQKPGTSGLRKKTKVFEEDNGRYLANFVQAVFDALGPEVQGCTLVLGGDGRYFNDTATQIIARIAIGNGVSKLLIGKDGFLSTPAASAVIRARGCYGGFIMSASHNPGGPEGDWGIKFNFKHGEPAPEWLTSAIFEQTKKINRLRKAGMSELDLSELGTRQITDGVQVEVIDPVEDYLNLMKQVFDFDMLRQFISRKDVTIKYDALHAVTGVYARRLLCDELGASRESVVNDTPKQDFNGGHPDPNMTYAQELVNTMYSKDGPYFGAASDGDGDRNMILGSSFFVAPPDSLAVLARHAVECIPWFRNGLKGAARSMPTAAAVDRVCEEKGVDCYETPTGWKFFGNLMDDGRINICGEESFGTGADHVREKDGLWAVLAWLSVLAYKNKDHGEEDKLVKPADILKELWDAYGRTFFCRYDYEGVDADSANKMVEKLRELKDNSSKGQQLGGLKLEWADEFAYTDPVDGSSVSKQGLRFKFQDGSRVVFRLSGTGAEGATVRIYAEKHETDEAKYDKDSRDALKPTIKAALSFSDLKRFTGRDNPTVVT